MVVPIDVKQSFLKSHAFQLKELSKRQSDYRRALAARMRNFRRMQMVQANLKQTIKRYRKERGDIKTQLWSATGASYKKESDKYEKQIKCHIQCEEKLGKDIQELKHGITNITRAIGRVSREIYDLNFKTIPDARASENAIKAQRRLVIKENLLEVGIHRECKLSAENSKLREELLELLNLRKYFNDHYLKLIQELNSDKKYMTDLIGYAMHQFDGSIELYEKAEALKKRDQNLIEQKKTEIRDLNRTKAAIANEMECNRKKTAHRSLEDLQPKEYRRREREREELKKQLNINRNVLNKIFAYTDQNNIPSVIEKFKEQESLYYSYFNYANETSYHMTLLNNAVNRLYSDIENLKFENRSTMQNQIEQIQSMIRKIEEKRKHNAAMRLASKQEDERLNKLFEGLRVIRDHTRTQWYSLNEKLGQYENVDIENLRDQLKLITNRIVGVLCTVYELERQKPRRREYLVKDLENICDYKTSLEDIVLAQQCPECAEVDALNIDDTENAAIMSVNAVKKKLYDKVVQPEMQYRLHSMSVCRFPRARMLTTKRNLEISHS